MNETGVLLFLHDSAPRQRFEETLKRAGCTILEPAALLTSPCELIVADQLDLSALPEPIRAAQTRGDIGLIQIGVPCGGDVVLPADCSSRELLIACRLLAEIVRLRRTARRQRDARRAWQRLAQRDPLTNILNRRSWNLALDSQLAAPGNKSQWCVVTLDVDHFKQINDQLGHAAGDAALQAIAGVLRRTVRRADVAARLGGDEFGVLLSDAEPAAIDGIVERIRRAAGEAASAAVGRPISLSAGYAVVFGSSPSQLMEAADTALREAKLAGRDLTRRFTVRESA